MKIKNRWNHHLDFDSQVPHCQMQFSPRCNSWLSKCSLWLSWRHSSKKSHLESMAWKLHWKRRVSHLSLNEGKSLYLPIFPKPELMHFMHFAGIPLLITIICDDLRWGPYNLPSWMREVGCWSCFIHRGHQQKSWLVKRGTFPLHEFPIPTEQWRIPFVYTNNQHKRKKNNSCVYLSIGYPLVN